MRHPVASTHLARVIHMTSAGSLARAIAEKRLVVKSTGPQDDQVLEPLRALAAEEKVLEEEARALAAQKGWPTNLAGAAYGWTRLGGDTGREDLPRILRIYAREIFELDQDLRAPGGDDDVRSIMASALEARRSVHAALAALDPQATVPGAK